jgi:hypothetical protein
MHGTGVSGSRSQGRIGLGGPRVALVATGPESLGYRVPAPGSSRGTAIPSGTEAVEGP